MDPMTIAALASAGIGGAQQLFGGRQERQRYKPSPYEQMVVDRLMEQYKGELPSWLTAPYYREAQKLEKSHAGEPGVSGLVSGIKARDIFGPMGEAGKAYKTGLMSTIGRLTRGTGEYETTQPMDFSSSLWDLGYALAMRKKGKGKKGEGGDKRSPMLFDPQDIPRGNYPYLWDEGVNV